MWFSSLDQLLGTDETFRCRSKFKVHPEPKRANVLLYSRCSNGLLLAENDMFERFLTHLDQLDHQAGTSALDGTGSTQRDTLSGTLGLQVLISVAP